MSYDIDDMIISENETHHSLWETHIFIDWIVTHEYVFWIAMDYLKNNFLYHYINTR